MLRILKEELQGAAERKVEIVGKLEALQEE
jgi:hypothetical protein